MDSIIFHIDNTIISLFKVHLEGWTISRNNQEVTVSSKKRIDCLKNVRADVNRCHDFVSEGMNSGFTIDIYSWSKTIIILNDGNSTITFCVDCPKFKKQFIVSALKKIHKKIKEVGMLKAIKFMYKRINDRHKNEDANSYMDWKIKNDVSSKELKNQNSEVFNYNPLISIVVPTFNTPSNFLVEMIESVLAQTYQNWELCIADGFSSDNQVINILKEYEKEYKQIKVKYLSENKMISENTNEAIAFTRGEFIGLLDHDDLLAPNALYEFAKLLNTSSDLDMIYSDEDKVDFKGINYFEPHFKPDYSKYTLRSYNYITHFTVIRKSILDEIGLFDSNCDGAQDYDMFLRVIDRTNKIGHVSKILYHWRVHDNSTSASASVKSYVSDAGKLALKKHLDRNGIKGSILDGLFPTSYKINYDLRKDYLVSIIIPNKDHIEDLKKCINSILDRTEYDNFEIIIVENNSEQEETFSYYKQIEENEKIKVIRWKEKFNYSAINNFGVSFAKGDHILLLNNDVEIINTTWLTELLMLSQSADVGCVGAKLYYEDGTIQHAGIIIGIGGVAGHSHKYYPHDSFGYVGRLKVVQNVSAVTAACLLIKKELFLEVGGLDENYKVAFNDVDFCLRVGKKGYQNIFTPYTELFHFESKSRGSEDTDEKRKRFNGEIKMFEKRWGLWKSDPYYNGNLTMEKEDFSLKINDF